MSTTEHKIAVMTAYSDNKYIEARELRDTAKWVAADTPCWDWYTYEYRIRPEPKEFWLAFYPDDDIRIHLTKHEAYKYCEGASSIIKVREVIV